MKKFLLVLAALPGLASGQPPAPGTLSDPVTFATFAGPTLMNSGLAAHTGKVVLLMYYTPW